MAADQSFRPFSDPDLKLRECLYTCMIPLCRDRRECRPELTKNKVVKKIC